jgi:hypothetical protein
MGIGVTIPRVLEFFFLHLLHACLKSQNCNSKRVSQLTFLAQNINFPANAKETVHLVIRNGKFIAETESGTML